MLTKAHLFRFIVLLFAFLALSACAQQAAVSPTAEPVSETTSPISEPITLQLGIPDGDNVLYAPYVLEFIQQAKTLSNGTITIEPTWEAGDSTSVGYEVGVIQLVKDGRFDLGLAASRSFDSENITSFQALQAPFLIDNDALAKAVATSDVASRMLENLSSSGLEGLTLWPEDLRHPFSVDPTKPLLSPEGFAGLTIRATDTGVGEMLIKALGGNPIFEATDYQGAESGLRQGASLTGQPAATGNVTFFAKYQVLFANGAAFEKLSDAQRTVLREAAAEAQKKALAERPSDVNAGAAWCADGGSIVLASDEQLAAFQKSAQPVFDQLQQDSFNTETIAAIRELKAKTQPSPSAQACASTSAASMHASTEDQIWSQGLLPNGVWQAELSIADLVAVGGVMESSVRENAGVHTFTFQDGNFTWTLQGDSPGSCEGTYSLVGDIVRLTATGGCAPEVDDIQWRLDDEGLHLHLVAIENAPFEVIRASLEARPYQKVEDNASASSATSSSPETFAGDMTWIAYQTNRSGSEGVWLIHPDGTGDHQIITDGLTVLLPDWSPDGKRLVVASRGGDTEPLYEYDLATETFRQLFECKDPCLGDDNPAYSPDGKKVAFTRALLPIVHSDAIGDDVPSDCGIWIGDIATGKVTQVTSNTNPPCDREYNPRWSPDGKQLVYFRDPFENGKPTGTALFVMNADGSGEHRLTDPVDFAGMPDWSPDGKWIVFDTFGLTEFNFVPKVSNLFRIHPDGSGLEQLTFNETTDLRATQPRYTPDGKWIIFTAVEPSSNTAERRSDRSLWAIPAGGGDPIVLAPGGIYTHGTWQP